MTIRLTPYGSAEHVHNIAKVGKKKTPRSLAERMPSADLAAKVGANVFSAGSQIVIRRNARG